jgi:myo-inositol 2-dehydrogenase/D-chiro-inositol 1-dehydrogenase
MVDAAIEEAGDIDTALITVQFADGTFGSIDNSRKAVYGYDQRVEVFGSKGVISSENNTPNRTILADSSGVHSALPLHFFMERYTESYLREFHDFVTSISDNTPTPVQGNDGRAPVVAALAAKKSLNERRPVPLSEIEVKVPD